MSHARKFESKLILCRQKTSPCQQNTHVDKGKKIRFYVEADSSSAGQRISLISSTTIFINLFTTDHNFSSPHPPALCILIQLILSYPLPLCYPGWFLPSRFSRCKTFLVSTKQLQQSVQLTVSTVQSQKSQREKKSSHLPCLKTRHITLFKQCVTKWSLRLYVNVILSKMVKVKCTLVQALRLCTGRTAHRGSTGIALLFLTTTLEGVRGQGHSPAALYPR